MNRLLNYKIVLRGIPFLFLVAGLYCAVSVIYGGYKLHHLETYTGLVVGKTPPNPAQKGYYILFTENNTKKVIRVEVTVPQYYNVDSGKGIAISISNYNLWKWGNTINAEKNLYEQ